MTLREAAQQALEAFESMYGRKPERVENVITALRAALAEHFCDTHCTWADHAPGCVRAEPVQEPVAWMDIASDGTRLSVRMWSEGDSDEVPLYLAPPQCKPLTEAQIYAAIKGIDSLKAVEVARAIERAHGIGEPLCAS